MDSSDEKGTSSRRAGIAGWSCFGKSGLNLTDGSWLMRRVIKDVYAGEVSVTELKRALGWRDDIFAKVKGCAVEQRILTVPDGKPRSLRISTDDEFRGSSVGVLFPIISRIPDEFKIRGTAALHPKVRRRAGAAHSDRS